MKASKNGKSVGVFIKDNFPGEFCESWRTTIKDKDFEQIDVSAAVGYVMCDKEDSEVMTIKKACLVTVDIFTKYLKDHIMEIIDADKVSASYIKKYSCILSCFKLLFEIDRVTK